MAGGRFRSGRPPTSLGLSSPRFSPAPQFALHRRMRGKHAHEGLAHGKDSQSSSPPRCASAECPPSGAGPSPSPACARLTREPADPASSIAPSSSASNSRVRDSDNWISIDAIGARRLIARRPTTAHSPALSTVPATEEQQCLRDSRNHAAHRRRDRRRQDVAVVDVHELVPEHSAQLTLIENRQDALRAAHRRVVRVTARRKSIRRQVGATQIVGIGCCARADSSRTIA